MQPLFFGPSAQQLYGVYHAAVPGAHRGEGVVLCNPVGQEYMRAHRSLRHLAGSLAAVGYDTLRFDYRGTGDSAGDLTDVAAPQWIDDVSLALQELRDTAEVERVSLLGLRTGALFAVEAAAKTPLNRLVLWDPVESGEAYLAEIRLEMAENPQPGNFVAPDGTIHFNGFALPPDFAKSIASMSLPSQPFPGAARVLLAISHEADPFSRIRDRHEADPGFEILHCEAPHDWNYVDHVGGLLFPQTILQAITEWFAEPQGPR
jgi:pimeloyl-ACP methyl ester carboxylesterase